MEYTMRGFGRLFLAVMLALPSPALAWGVVGHQTIAALARGYLTPTAKAAVDAILAKDAGTPPAANLVSASTWADAWRAAGHKETATWHYVDLELDHPDLNAACYGFPKTTFAASAGPPADCVVDKIEAFEAELRNPATPAPERLLALKYLIHFVGDLHQPLHAADNRDHGGNCVRLALGELRTVNLHTYWDTGVVAALDSDPERLAATLRSRITPAERRAWSAGGPRQWARESFRLARTKVYILGSVPGCDGDAAPLALPVGYEDRARAVAASQIERAGVRLATLLNRAFR